MNQSPDETGARQSPSLPTGQDPIEKGWWHHRVRALLLTCPSSYSANASLPIPHYLAHSMNCNPKHPFCWVGTALFPCSSAVAKSLVEGSQSHTDHPSKCKMENLMPERYLPRNTELVNDNSRLKGQWLYSQHSVKSLYLDTSLSHCSSFSTQKSPRAFTSNTTFHLSPTLLGLPWLYIQSFNRASTTLCALLPVCWDFGNLI